MALTDTFVKQIKHGDKRGKAGVIDKWNTAHGQPTDSKWTDGDGMFLHVKASGRYWRMDYTRHGKRRTLALGVYPAVSLADARKGQTAAQELIARGIDPNTSKQDARRTEKLAAAKPMGIVKINGRRRHIHEDDKRKRLNWISGSA